jgi:hypothetical protein
MRRRPESPPRPKRGDISPQKRYNLSGLSGFQVLKSKERKMNEPTPTGAKKKVYVQPTLQKREPLTAVTEGDPSFLTSGGPRKM